jgi:hypothetical protein
MPMPMPGHGGHHPDKMMCSMSMVWNTSTLGLCIVFPSWQITGTQSLIATLLALFLLSVLLEYLRLCIRSLDAHLITSHHLTNGILSAFVGNASPSHRRKASVQQKRQVSTQGIGSILSSSVNASTVGDRRQTADTNSNSSSWGPSDDDAPLLPAPNMSRSTRNLSMRSRVQSTFM